MAKAAKRAKAAPPVQAKKARRAPRVPCDARSAHAWRFNLEEKAVDEHPAPIVTTVCQGNVIRRKMYTTTGRLRTFNLCRRHQVEVGSMTSAHRNLAR